MQGNVLLNAKNISRLEESKKFTCVILCNRSKKNPLIIMIKAQKPNPIPIYNNAYSIVTRIYLSIIDLYLCTFLSAMKYH